MIVTKSNNTFLDFQNDMIHFLIEGERKKKHSGKKYHVTYNPKLSYTEQHNKLKNRISHHLNMNLRRRYHHHAKY